MLSLSRLDKFYLCYVAGSYPSTGEEIRGEESRLFLRFPRKRHASIMSSRGVHVKSNTMFRIKNWVTGFAVLYEYFPSIFIYIQTSFQTYLIFPFRYQLTMLFIFYLRVNKEFSLQLNAIGFWWYEMSDGNTYLKT